jgi:hypothetical protein
MSVRENKVFIENEDIYPDQLLDGEMYYVFDQFGFLEAYGYYDATTQTIMSQLGNFDYDVKNAPFLMKRPTISKLTFA